MNTTKSAITDEGFLARILEHCSDDVERGWLITLYVSGMHGASLRTLSIDNLHREGDRYFLKWRRTKTKKLLEVEIPFEKLDLVRTFLQHPRKPSLRWMNHKLHAWGKLAGYDGLSTMTFRHSRCARMILEHRPERVIRQAMGCSSEVIDRAYGKLTPEQLREATR